jgi:hypothetical protein
VPIRWVLVRDPFARFDPQALLSTDLALEPLAIVRYFVRRWQVEVTFEECRRHVGLETQRQWSDRAVARTTPVLLSLFSPVTLLATRVCRGGSLPIAQAAWYQKPTPTFSDAPAAVRAELWRHQGFVFSADPSHIPKPARAAVARPDRDLVPHRLTGQSRAK